MTRLLALVLALLPLAAAEALADGKETLDAAGAAYYSLRREGLTSFSCLVTPNWDLLLASRWRTDPAAAAKAYKAFSSLTIGVEVAPGQKMKVLHAEPPAGSDAETEAVKRLVGGMEQTLIGFFDIWAPFVLTTPIPGPTAEMTQAHGVWIVDFKEGAKISIGLVMRPDYTIETARILTETNASVIQPQFVKSPKGLLLSALQGSYRTLPTGPAYTLQFRIEYQDVGGFMLPRRLLASSSNGQGIAQMDMTFGTCQAQHR